MKHPSLKVIALDFDGTLVESNHIKDQAFRVIFGDWPEHKETMIRWHLSHNTIDRKEKFHYFVEKILNMPENNKLINKLTNRFSKLTKKLIIECPLVEGAMEFLEYFHGRIPLFLVSATPQRELNEIILARELQKYFIKIYGAPINKTETLEKIMETEKVSADQMIYIGDSPEDQKAAKDIGIHFAGRMSDRTLSNKTILIYNDMKSILYNLKIDNKLNV